MRNIIFSAPFRLVVSSVVIPMWEGEKGVWIPRISPRFLPVPAGHCFSRVPPSSPLHLHNLNICDRWLKISLLGAGKTRDRGESGDEGGRATGNRNPGTGRRNFLDGARGQKDRTGQSNLKLECESTRAENPGMDKARRKVLRPSSSPC